MRHNLFYCQNCFYIFSSIQQRCLRGLTVAKCYANVGEYRSALQYISTYLSIKSNTPQAYRLQGECYEKLGKTELALQSYQTSLQLAPNQPDLITNVCKLFLATDLLTGQHSKARHWCNQAKSLNIQNETVLNLNLLLTSKETNSNNGENVEKLIASEIVARPTDIGLYIRLVKHYLDNGKIDDAFSYVYTIEMKQQDLFSRSLDWQNTIGQMLNKYKQFTKDYDKNWKFWLMLIGSIERQLFLNLCTDSPATHSLQTIISDCVNLLFEFDQQLELISKSLYNICPELELAPQFMSHYRGQFCLHAASLLFKKELIRMTHWHETARTALPLLLLAYDCGTVNTIEPWLRDSTETTKKLMDLWNRDGAFRCAQAGRTLLGCIDDANANNIIAIRNIRKICIDNDSNIGWYSADELLLQIRKICSDGDWRKMIFKLLFNTTDIVKINSSYFMQCAQLAEPQYELPIVCDLDEYEDIAQWVNPSSLSHMVYLSMAQKNDIDIKCGVFNGITFSVSNLMNCGAETLNELDIDSFLFATTVQTKRKFEIDRNTYEFDNKMLDVTTTSGSTRPKWLPYANISHKLCTDEQETWWSMAYKLYHNKSIGGGNEPSDVRATIQYGIETIRGISGSKMDAIIALRLGKIFVQRSENAPTKTERTFLEIRAETLYKYSLQQIKRDGSSRMDSHRKYFKYDATGNMQDNERELNRLAEDAITYLAGRYIEMEKYEECIDELANIPLPTATYFQSQAYRFMNESKEISKKNKRVYIEKAKECLNLTMALLELPNFEKSHPLKTVVNNDLMNLQQIQTKFDSSLHNGSNTIIEDYLNDSLTSVRHRRDASFTAAANTPSGGAAAATKSIQPQVIELENLVRKMMETLTLVRDEIVDVKNEVGDIKTEMNGIVTKLNSIEKKQDTQQNIEPPVLDDYFVIEDELNNQAYGSSMYPNYNQQQQQQQSHQHQQRINTPNQMLSNQMIGGGGAVPSNAAALSAAMNPYNNQFYNSVYSMGLNNPYHNAMMSQPPRVGYQYADQYGYGLPSQQPAAVAQLPDPRNSVIGLLTQPPVIPPPAAAAVAAVVPAPALVMPIGTTQLQQQPLSIVQPQLSISATTASTDKSNQSNLLRTWNSSYNNAPVEKTLPANVVITNSDPLPAHTMITAQPTLSVTIPSHHIKSNPSAIVPPSLDTFASQASLFTQNLSQTDNVSATIAAVAAGSPAASSLSTGTTTNRKETPAKDVQQQPKSLFGGISFSSTPIATPTQNSKIASTSSNDNKNQSATKTTSDAPKPFAGFSFGTSGQNEKPLNSIFSNLNRSPASTTTTNNATAAANTSKEDVDDYVPTAQFEPVIALPELIEVKTGEENEIVTFEYRAKLMRFVKDTKEWKERGIGNIKVLVNKNDSNKVRLLMRRDQVLKLCCNQMLSKSTTFTVMPKVETALTWYGQDYSENELQVELFAIRFKTVDIRKQFHDAILDAQKMMTDDATDATNLTKPKSTDAKKTDKKKDTNAVASVSTIGFGDKFKPIVGSWSCDSCYVTNKSDSTVCVSCKTVKSNGKSTTAQPIEKSKSAPSKPPPVVNNGFGDKFKPKTGSWSCKQCYITNAADVQYCAACESPKDDTVPKKEPKGISLTTTSSTKFSFGIPPSSSSSTTVTPATQSFSFGIQPAQTTAAAVLPPTTTGSGFSFGSFTAMSTTNAGSNILFGAATNTGSTASSDVGGFSFKNLPSKDSSTPIVSTESATAETVVSSSSSSATTLPPKESFSFVFKPKAPATINKAKSPIKLNVSGGGCGTENVSDDENIEEEENNTYFTPVIPLPEKIDVKTGEEGEEILYSHRAKLFRFADSEWKERGLGDVKILKHKETMKLRVVMRREQILKICLNHMLTDEIEYKQKDDKSWHFVAIDYSDGEIQPMQFCLRFKTKDIAQEFYAAAMDALASSSGAQSSDSANNSTLNDTTSTASVTDEIVVVQQTKCTGCRGCNPDDFKFAEIKDININNVSDDQPLPLVMPPMKITTIHSGKNIVVPSSTTRTTAAASAVSAKTSESTKNIFGEFNVNVSGANSNFFTQTSFCGDNNSNASTTTNIFGNSALPTTAPAKETNSIFSLTPMFGAGNTVGNTTTNNITSGSTFLFGDALKTIASDTDNKTSSSASTFSFENTFANSCLTAKPSNTTTTRDSGESKPFSIFGGGQPVVTPLTSIFSGKGFFFYFFLSEASIMIYFFFKCSCRIGYIYW